MLMLNVNWSYTVWRWRYNLSKAVTVLCGMTKSTNLKKKKIECESQFWTYEQSLLAKNTFNATEYYILDVRGLKMKEIKGVRILLMKLTGVGDTPIKAKRRAPPLLGCQIQVNGLFPQDIRPFPSWLSDTPEYLPGLQPPSTRLSRRIRSHFMIFGVAAIFGCRLRRIKGYLEYGKRKVSLRSFSWSDSIWIQWAVHKKSPTIFI